MVANGQRFSKAEEQFRLNCSKWFRPGVKWLTEREQQATGFLKFKRAVQPELLTGAKNYPNFACILAELCGPLQNITNTYNLKADRSPSTG